MTILLVVPALLTAQPVPPQPNPQRYQEELRNVQTLRSSERKNPTEALRQLDRMLGVYKDAAWQKELTQLKADTLNQLKKHDEAMAELDKLRKAYAEDKELAASSLLLTGDSQKLKGQLPEALATYQGIAKDYADQAERAADALLRAGDLLATEMKKPSEAVPVYKDIEARFATQVRPAADGKLRAAALLETQLKDPLQAAQLYQSVVEKQAAAFNEQQLCGFYAKAGENYRAAAKLPEGAALLQKGEKALEQAQYKMPLALQALSLRMEMKMNPQARAEAERVICTYPLEMDTCQAAQAVVVESYKAEGKLKEALGAARVLYDGAGSEKTVSAGAHVVAQMLRAVDGNLGRANDFLGFQRFGPAGPDGKPGTEDDIKANVLATIEYQGPTDPAKFAAAVAAQPNTVEGYRAKAFLLIYSAKPKEATQQFLAAFRLAPDTAIPGIVQEMVLVGVKAMQASYANLDQVFEFISYGPKGKNGQQNLPNPFAGM
jgi:tetratricopeptide (TPR) repeat protein